MIDPTKIDALIEAAHQRDNAVTHKLLQECSRLAANVSDPPQPMHLMAAHKAESGKSAGYVLPPPENGSFAYQLFSSIMFAVDARAELKLLELIASPNFYNAIMRSAAEVKPS